jgi:hypothetical protein
MPPRKKKEPGTALVPADLEATLGPQRQEAELALQMIQGLDLTTQRNRDKAGLALAEIRSRRTDLDKQRKGITGPILEGKRMVDALFKPVDEYWEACDHALTSRLLEATKAVDAAQIKALAEVAATKGDTDSLTLQAAHTTAQTPQGLDLRRTWSFRIIDVDRIPDEYWRVDEDKIRRVVVAARGEIDIPGVVVEQEQSFARARGAA